MLGRRLNRLLDAGRGAQGDDVQAIRGALEDFLHLAEHQFAVRIVFIAGQDIIAGPQGFDGSIKRYPTPFLRQ